MCFAMTWQVYFSCFAGLSGPDVSGSCMLFEMLTLQRCHLLLLLLAVLGGWSADGAENLTEAEEAWMSSIPSSRSIVVREGSSVLLECNVTGALRDIKWYNSKGALLVEGEGMTRKSSPLPPHTAFHQKPFTTVGASDAINSFNGYFQLHTKSFSIKCLIVQCKAVFLIVVGHDGTTGCWCLLQRHSARDQFDQELNQTAPTSGPRVALNAVLSLFPIVCAWWETKNGNLRKLDDFFKSASRVSTVSVLQPPYRW